MTPYLLANLAGLLLLACGGVGLVLAAIALLNGWQLVGVASAVAVIGGLKLARLDARTYAVVGSDR